MDGRTIHGPQLRALREEADIRVEPFAVLTGIKGNYLRDIEKGRRQPSGIVAHRFIRVLTAALNRPVTFDAFSTAREHARRAS